VGTRQLKWLLQLSQLLKKRTMTSGGNQTADIAGGAEQSTIPAANSSQFMLSILITERGEERQL
jgi:hypothetical protein